MNPTRIESVTIRGFRSLADFAISEMPNAAVLIGANGSGKSNFIRFFEMMSWMLRSRNLAEFIERQGGADDQLFRGSRRTPRLEAEINLRTESGRYDYGFALVLCSPRPFLLQRGKIPVQQRRESNGGRMGIPRQRAPGGDDCRGAKRWTRRKFDNRFLDRSPAWELFDLSVPRHL